MYEFSSSRYNGVGQRRSRPEVRSAVPRNRQKDPTLDLNKIYQLFNSQLLTV